MPLPSGAQRTSFDPSTHGLKFSNDFRNDFIPDLDVKTGGLCGGMSYTSLDYFFAETEVPSQTEKPHVGSELHDYVYDRQVHSILQNLDKWMEVGLNPFGTRNSEFFKWGLEAKEGGRLWELDNAISEGRPVPLGLQTYGEGGPGNHQVIAYGYDAHGYEGRLGTNADKLEIFVWDPNYPRENGRRTLVPDTTNEAWCYEEDPSRRWRTYFVDRKYRPHEPPRMIDDEPAAEGLVKTVFVSLATGDDDLRGGDDNLDLCLTFSDGSAQEFPNVNRGQRWIDHYTQTVPLRLTTPKPPTDLEELRLDTTFRGGMGGDNWNLQGVEVTVEGLGLDSERALFRGAGDPLHRFTGDDGTWCAPLRW